MVVGRWFDHVILTASLISEIIPSSAVVLFISLGFFAREGLRLINQEIDGADSEGVVESQIQTLAKLSKVKHNYIHVIQLVKKLNSGFGGILLFEIVYNLVGLTTDSYTIFFILSSPGIDVDYSKALTNAFFIFFKYLPTLFIIFFAADEIRAEVNSPISLPNRMKDAK